MPATYGGTSPNRVVYTRERDTEVRNGEIFCAGESVRHPDSGTCRIRKAVIETESANQATLLDSSHLSIYSIPFIRVAGT